MEKIISNGANSNNISIALNNNAYEAGLREIDPSSDTNIAGSNLIDVSAESTTTNGYILTGSVGSDTINGGAGADTINGGAGADTISGGAGTDAISGGTGADTLVFNNLSAADTVTDFVVGEDLIRLAKSAMAALGATGALTASEFVSGAGLAVGQDASDRVVYNTTDGALYYDADGSGAGAAVLLATFTGAPELTVAHFTVI